MLFSRQDVAEPPFKWIEFFAGKAEATNQFQVGGFHSAKLDLLYMHAQPGKLNPMDLTSEAGMGNLRLNMVLMGYPKMLMYIISKDLWVSLFSSRLFSRLVVLQIHLNRAKKIGSWGQLWLQSFEEIGQKAFYLTLDWSAHVGPQLIQVQVPEALAVQSGILSIQALFVQTSLLHGPLVCIHVMLVYRSFFFD